MHELAMAEAIVAIATDQAGPRRVARVELKVGYLRQVVPSALRFGFELAAQGTCAEGAELTIEPVPARGACRGCGAETQLTGFPFACARCGGIQIDVTSGEELSVEALEVLDEPAGGDRPGHDHDHDREEVGDGGQR